MSPLLPPGKIPPHLLQNILNALPHSDPRLRLGPGMGLDCAVLEAGPELWVLKSDPITFATAEIGWYLVQVNANDIATTGADPRWLMVTLLLPERSATADMVTLIAEQIAAACREIGVVVIGGHTEITTGLDRPIAMGTMIGLVSPERLITPQGCAPGDWVLLTRSAAIEATAILAREKSAELSGRLSLTEIQQARDFLYQPGISILRDARLAQKAGRVSAMHDPTEGGIATALWELAEAAGCALHITAEDIPVHPLTGKVCAAFGIDPLGAISSGALLLTAPAAEAERILEAMTGAGIPCRCIGSVEEGTPAVWLEGSPGLKMKKPARDEIARVFEASV